MPKGEPMKTYGFPQCDKCGTVGSDEATLSRHDCIPASACECRFAHNPRFLLHPKDSDFVKMSITCDKCGYTNFDYGNSEEQVKLRLKLPHDCGHISELIRCKLHGG